MLRFAWHDYCRRFFLSSFVSLLMAVIMMVGTIYTPVLVDFVRNAYAVKQHTAATNTIASQPSNQPYYFATYTTVKWGDNDGAVFYKDRGCMVQLLSELVSLEGVCVVLPCDDAGKAAEEVKKPKYMILLGSAKTVLPRLDVAYLDAKDTSIVSVPESEKAKMALGSTVNLPEMISSAKVAGYHENLKLLVYKMGEYKSVDISQTIFLRMPIDQLLKDNPKMIVYCLSNIVLSDQGVSPEQLAKRAQLIETINAEFLWGNITVSASQTLQVTQDATADAMQFLMMIFLVTFLIALLTTATCITFMIRRNEREYSVHRLYGATPFQIARRIVWLYVLLMIPSVFTGGFYAMMLFAPAQAWRFSLMPLLPVFGAIAVLGVLCLASPFYALKQQRLELLLRSTD